MKTNGKMKWVGYILLGSALIMSFLLFTGKVDANPVRVDLIKYWAGIAILLLFGNAGKRILGGIAQGKAEGNENK